MSDLARGIRDGVRRFFMPDVRGAERAKQSLRAEVEAHIEARIAYLLMRGVSEEDARREAIARFGGDLDRALHTLEASAAESDRQLSLHDRIESITQDLRFIMRGLGRARTFTAGIVATLTLGLGINSGVFRIADRVLTRAPSGVVAPDELRRVSLLQANGNAAPTESPAMSYPQARAIADSRAFGRVGLYATARGLQTAEGRELAGIYVDSGFFAALGVHPVVGRFFDASEAEPGSNYAVAVVSHELWQSQMGAADIASAQPLRIGEKSYRIIGVAPRGFTGVELDPVDIWLPFGVAALGKGTVNGVDIPWYRLTMIRAIRVVGRIAAGSTEAATAARASAAAPGGDSQFSSASKGVRLSSIHAGDPSAAGPRRMLARLIAVSLLVLVIACANAANLLLARGLRRRRELSVRLALGAGRARIIRLLVLESVILGLIGGAAAGLAGHWLGDALRRLVFPDARWTTTPFDSRAIVFTSVVALIAGVAAGLAPATQLTTPDLVTGLKDNRYQPGRRSHRTRAGLIVLQTAFSLCLLIASGLLVRSLQRLNEVDLGFEPRGLLTIELPSKWSLEPGAPDIAAADVAEQLRRARGVHRVALSSNAPFGSHSGAGLSVPGRPQPDIPPSDGPWYSLVNPEFFPAMGIRLVRGRLFNASDVAGSQPVVVVNETMARYYWNDADPFASCILARNMCARVVGIVSDVRDFRSGGPPPPRYYFALAQQDEAPRAIVVRADPSELPALVLAVKSIVRGKLRPTVRLVEDRVNEAMRPWRVAAQLFVLVGVVALVLSCVGVYSVMSYVTSERIPELGVRLVLGATSGMLVSVVLKSGLRLVFAGIAFGVAAALLGARLLSALLYGVSPFDPAVYIGAVGALAAAGLCATLVPALLVLRIDPSTALRSE